jgi:hypothetical protein
VQLDVLQFVLARMNVLHDRMMHVIYQLAAGGEEQVVLQPQAAQQSAPRFHLIVDEGAEQVEGLFGERLTFSDNAYHEYQSPTFVRVLRSFLLPQHVCSAVIGCCACVASCVLLRASSATRTG